MNDEIKLTMLTYLLFSVYPINRSKWPQTTQNRQVHAKQEVGQLYFIIYNSIVYFWEIEWIPIQSLINHPIQEFPYKVLHTLLFL